MSLNSPFEPAAVDGEPLALRAEHQSQLQHVVVEAVQVASARGMPLAAISSATDPALDETKARASRELPREPPWQQITPGAARQARDVDILSVLAAIEPYMVAVEARLEQLITAPVKLIADVASHTLGAGGKRLRPALTVLAARLCGAPEHEPDPAVALCAALVELTHTTTLLHDDVVDGAEVRRGKPAANLIWGNETSVLVGDYLVAQVFVSASQEGLAHLMYPLALATSRMCAGELLETQTRRHLDMTEKQYQEIVSLKTASLTDCACRLGALAVEAPAEQVEALGRYGHDVGMAFQIIDDVFDVVASEVRIGKPVGNDIREGDITLPMLRIMQTGSEAQCAELRRIVGKTPIEDHEVEAALEILRSGDAVHYCLGVAAGYVTAAKGQLAQFPEGDVRTMFNDIADYILCRTR